MRKKILFRADGNTAIGLGHLYRLFAVIEMLKNDYDFCLVTKETSTTAIIPTKYPIRLIPKDVDFDSEPQWLADNFSSNDYIVFADGYAFDSSYQKRIKELEYQLVYIDDLVQEYMYADVVINHSPSVVITDYTSESYTIFGLGIPYAILRPRFLLNAQKYKTINAVNNIFICFGGSDIYDLTYNCLVNLIHLDQIKTFHIVIGGAYSHQRIFKLQKENPDSVFLHQNLSEDEISDVINSCQLAIVPTSTICYEACATKILILGGYYTENQKGVYQGLLDEKLIFDGGCFTTKNKIEHSTQVKKILDMPILEKNLFINRQAQSFDGNSGDRIIQLLKKLN